MFTVHVGLYTVHVGYISAVQMSLTACQLPVIIIVSLWLTCSRIHSTHKIVQSAGLVPSYHRRLHMSAGG